MYMFTNIRILYRGSQNKLTFLALWLGCSQTKGNFLWDTLYMLFYIEYTNCIFLTLDPFL